MQEIDVSDFLTTFGIMKPIIIPIVLSAVVLSSCGTTTQTFCILDYGACGDGVSDCTQAVNAAIDICSEAGGGTVLVPEGRFLCSTLHLRDNVNLHLDKGAVIVACPNPERYDSFIPRTDLTRFDSGEGTLNSNCSGDRFWNRTLILGEEVHNVSITGEGTIDGGHVFDPDGEERMRGPHCILFALSSGILLEGISVTRASNYAFMNYAVEDVRFKGVRITEGWDGIHIRGGRNIEIDGCVMETGDDCIAGGYWENALIRDCDLNSSCNGIRIIMPSEHVTVSGCRITGPGRYPHRTSGRFNTLFGIEIEPGGWGPASGTTADITIEDIRMDGVSSPIGVSIRPGNEAVDLKVRNLDATGVYGTFSPVVCWNDEGFSSMELENCRLSR